MRRVVITGAGLVTPLGHDSDRFFDALLAGRSGIQVVDAPWGQPDDGPCIAAPVRMELDSHFTKLKRLSLDRVTQLSLIAARQAMAAAGLPDGAPAEQSNHAGTYWGTGMGGAGTLENTYRDIYETRVRRLKPTTVIMVMTSAATGQIAIEFGLKGPSLTLSSACSSSSVAIGEAWRAIRDGSIDLALAGGAESLLVQGVMRAWDSLQTLAKVDEARPETSARPFSADRSGFVLGEGAGALVLESEESALARGAPILAEMVGYGNSTDAGHITQPDAEGQARAMILALSRAGLAPEAVQHINAHGTGTKLGDISETKAIRQVFGPHADRIAVSATKALHGHLMGGGGAVEFIAALKALERGQVPPTAHLYQPDPDCDLDYVSNGPRTLANLDVVMSNSFAFGGSNAVLVAKRYR